MRRTLWQITCLISFGLTVSAIAAEPFQQDGGADGIVSMEAEHYDNKVETSTNTWSAVTTATGFTAPEGFSGGQAMQVMPATSAGGKTVKTGYATNAPHLDFQVNFVKTGTHYVWILGFGIDGNGDSAHSGLDGQEISTCDNMSGWQVAYNWSKTTMDGPAATFEVEEVGVHTVNIYMREDGMVFDKIVVTTNADYTPTGHGPAESSRGIPDYATSPVPADGAVDVVREISLAWTPGPSSTLHDVYFGTVLADVSDASRTDPRNVLVGQGQDANTYEPAARLEFDTTYYWRVDEIGATSTSIIEGIIWSFTTEPYAYPLTGITATASSSDEGSSPEDTINDSGMDGDGHGTDNATMWLSNKTAAQPAWIQYEFDGVYKLYEMWVWNHNVLFSDLIGFGFKDVRIEYSLDGQSWSVLNESTEFAAGPGAENYAHNTTVDLAGAIARYVRLTALSNWSGTRPQFGLSEVRFYYLPVSPREPQPADGATDLAVDTVLSWRAGREAGSHTVYFGADQQAVADGTASPETVSASSLEPGPLDLGTTYYWKVVEVNEAETPASWTSDVWTFSTKQYEVIDDFESYNDTDNCIYDTWMDGLIDKLSGSMVGYMDALEGTFGERTIVHGGKQSMPITYDNTGTYYYSQAERAWDTQQDWTVNGADTLTLYFRGNAVGFLQPTADSITLSGGGADIWDVADQFRFAFKSLSGDGSIVARIDSLGNSDVWAKAGLMIRDSLDPGAKNAMVYVTPDGRAGWQWRLLAAGTCDSTRSDPGAITLPHWLRLTRTGATVKVEHSNNGTTWEAITETANPTEPTFRDMSLSPTVYIGLAVTSHTADALTTAEFSSIATTGAVTGAWQVQEIGLSQPVNDAAPLYVTVQDATGKKTTVFHPDPEATILTSWQEWRIPLSQLTTAGVNVARVKKLYIGIGDPASSTPGGAGIVYIDDIGFGHPIP
ncbi:MAG: discoidin domain-containing protein [Phycisphaerae bacterium]|nr:discoidin domain-containing protein [Phycisphaerae bacterium]